MFITLLILTVIAISGSAAYFSIYGLASIFSGTFLPVVVMGSSLEVGKLVAVSALYRLRKQLSFLVKTYLVIAIFVLMVITSVGIFGFLSMGYQKDILPLNEIENRIELLTSQKQELQDLKAERLERKQQIDKQIANLPNNYVTARQRLMKSFGPEIEQLTQDVADYTDRITTTTAELTKLSEQRINQKVHTGPIIYIAKVFNKQVDDATKYMILLIIFAFDPLAVALTIGANAALTKKELEPQKETPEPIIEESPVSNEAIESVMRDVLDEEFGDSDEKDKAINKILNELGQLKNLTTQTLSSSEEQKHTLDDMVEKSKKIDVAKQAVRTG